MNSNTSTKPVEGSLVTEKIGALEVESLESVTPSREDAPKTAKEQYQRLWKAIKAEKRFVLWTLYVMLIVFGWGFDNGLSGVAIAFPDFRKRYGDYHPDAKTASEQYTIPALWQSLWNAASTIGQVFSGLLAGQLADTVGRKLLLYIAVTLSLASSFALVFAPDLPVLFVSKLLLGLSIGLSTAVPPLYVTENAPSHLRSTASSLTNVIIVFGFFISSLTGFGASHINGQWSYRLAFLMTFVMPAIFACGLPFLPESPVWYMEKGREDEARKAALRLFGVNADIDSKIEKIKDELKALEDENAAYSQTSWRAIFSKEHRSRTLVAVLGLQSQNLSGGYYANTYQTYVFELLGHSNSFGLTAISSTLQLIANFTAVALSDVVPRRRGLITGGSILMIWSLVIAGTSMAPTTNTAAAGALLAFMITWSMLYTATVGCYGWAVAQETAAQATRPKTISFTLICQQLTALLISSVFPFFINPDQLNFGGKVMFIFTGAELLVMALLFRFQPETKNRTYTDIDALYAAGVAPRKFRDFIVVDGEVVPKARSNGFFGRFSKA